MLALLKVCTWYSAIPATFLVLYFLTSCHKENNSPKGNQREFTAADDMDTVHGK